MLTTDLIRVRRRSGRLVVAPLKPAETKRLLQVAEAFLTIVRNNLGTSRAQIGALCDDVEYEPTDYKLIKGLRKLISDRCTFEVPEGMDPRAVRNTLREMLQSVTST